MSLSIAVNVKMKITIPSAILTTLLFGGSTSSGRVVRAFSTSSSIGLTTTAGVTRTTSSTVTNGRSSKNANQYYYSATALRAAQPTGAKLTTPPIKLSTSSTTMEEMIAMTDVFIFDCDGVIWRVSVYNTHNLMFVF
jgi:hypothetical protein